MRAGTESVSKAYTKYVTAVLISTPAHRETSVRPLLRRFRDARERVGVIRSSTARDAAGFRITARAPVSLPKRKRGRERMCVYVSETRL